MATTKTSKKTVKPAKTANLRVRSNLQPVGELISQSWKSLLANFGSFTALFFMQMFAVFVVVGIALIIGLAGGLGVGLSGQNWETLLQGNNLVPVILTAGAFVIALLVIAGVVLTFVSLMFQGAMIAVAAAGEDKISIGEALRIGRSKVVPLFVVGLLGGLLIWGGFFAFIIPGLFFSILFSMAIFAVILDNQTGLTALRTSATMVKQFFWEVLGRIALLVALNIGVAILVGMVTEASAQVLGEDFGGLLAFFLNIVINIGTMGFTLIYFTSLYKQLRRASLSTPVVSLKWMVIVAVIGLVMFGFLAAGMVKAAEYVIKNLPAMTDGQYENIYQDFSKLENKVESGEEVSEEEWESIMRDALEEATASGNVNRTDDSMMNFDY